MQVWRVHVRPGGGTVSHQESYDLCVRNNIIGIGWAYTEAFSWEPLSFRDYLAKFTGEDGSRDTALGRLRNMEQHDLVWIRSPKPYKYHLCRIVGPWDYRDAAKYRAADILNVRPVEMIEIAADDVPREVDLRFKGGSTIDPIRDQSQLDATINIWRARNADV